MFRPSLMLRTLILLLFPLSHLTPWLCVLCRHRHFCPGSVPSRRTAGEMWVLFTDTQLIEYVQYIRTWSMYATWQHQNFSVINPLMNEKFDRTKAVEKVKCSKTSSWFSLGTNMSCLWSYSFERHDCRSLREMGTLLFIFVFLYWHSFILYNFYAHNSPLSFISRDCSVVDRGWGFGRWCRWRLAHIVVIIWLRVHTWI